MPEFGSKSLATLATVHPALQALFAAVVQVYDCSVVSGRRTAEEQAALYAEGRTTLDGVEKLSRHQPEYWLEKGGPLVAREESGAVLVGAVDVVPYPVNWNNRERFVHFAGYVDGVARSMGIVLVWGGDWNSNVYRADNGLRDQSFDDLPHFQIASLDERWT